MVIWHNGALLEPDAACIAATSAGLTLGWGVFTTIGIYNGRPFAIERHLARLRHDAAATDIEITYADSEIHAALTGVLRANEIDAGIARITISQRGDGRWSTAAGSDLTILAATRAPLPLDGLRIMLSSYRLDARRPLTGLKATSHLEYQWISREAQAHGCDEAIFCNSAGVVCEGARSNVFWVRNGELSTPALSSGCLPGIGRALVCEWAAQMGIVVREGAYAPQELAMADEVFITSATTGPRAVEAFSDGFSDEPHKYASPGEVTRRLQERWAAETQSAA